MNTADRCAARDGRRLPMNRASALACAAMGIATIVMASCTTKSGDARDAESTAAASAGRTSASDVSAAATAGQPTQGSTFQLPTPPIPSINPSGGTGQLVLHISGSGETSYALAPASCDTGGFAASADDGAATVSYRQGSLRIELAGAGSPIVVDAAAQRGDRRWTATAVDASRGLSASAAVDCA
jgi:hypothetical protein